MLPGIRIGKDRAAAWGGPPEWATLIRTARGPHPRLSGKDFDTAINNWGRVKCRQRQIIAALSRPLPGAVGPALGRGARAGAGEPTAGGAGGLIRITGKRGKDCRGAWWSWSMSRKREVVVSPALFGAFRYEHR